MPTLSRWWRQARRCSPLGWPTPTCRHPRISTSRPPPRWRGRVTSPQIRESPARSPRRLPKGAPDVHADREERPHGGHPPLPEREERMRTVIAPGTTKRRRSSPQRAAALGIPGSGAEFPRGQLASVGRRWTTSGLAGQCGSRHSTPAHPLPQVRACRFPPQSHRRGAARCSRWRSPTPTRSVLPTRCARPSTPGPRRSGGTTTVERWESISDGATLRIRRGTASVRRSHSQVPGEGRSSAGATASTRST